MEKQTLTERLDRAAGRLCGGYYEPKTDQEGADGALMLEAKDRITALEAAATKAIIQVSAYEVECGWNKDTRDAYESLLKALTAR